MHPSKPKSLGGGALAVSQRVSNRTLVPFAVLLLLQALYVTYLTRQAPPVATTSRQAGRCSESSSHLPEVFIFRRSKKTGSSSMLESLMTVTNPLGYVPLYHGPLMMLDVVRAEGLKSAPRRLLIAQHNRVTRETTTGRKTVIADTIIDGYRQVTSYCRYFEKVADCNDAMVACLESLNARQLNSYRWGGRLEEDADTFIDMPLSSAHPGISTTVFRHIFEGATLDVQKINSVGSACPESPRLRAVYSKYYGELDAQVDRLRMRMLAMAGYPVIADRKYNITTSELLDRAEEIEKGKYNLGAQKVSNDMSAAIHKLWRGKDEWERTSTGEIMLKKK